MNEIMQENVSLLIFCWHLKQIKKNHERGVKILPIYSTTYTSQDTILKECNEKVSCFIFFKKLPR